MISIVYVTNRGPYPLTDERLRHLSQYRVLSDCLHRQTFTDFELICVVKGWEDHGPDCVRTELRWLKDRCRFVAPKETPWDKSGAFNPSAARNTGLNCARGDVVFFLDDCTSFGPNVLAQIAARAMVGQFLVPVYVRPNGSLWRWKDNCHCGGIITVPKIPCAEAGGWEERFAGTYSLEDWEFSSRMSRSGIVFTQSDECQVKLEAHEPRKGDYLRCPEAVYALLDGQNTANVPWTEAQFKVFSGPSCMLQSGSMCLLKSVSCMCPIRPTETTLSIMQSYEMVV